VAERLGFNHGEALSFEKAWAGLNAQNTERRLGIFKPTPKEIKKVREGERGECATQFSGDFGFSLSSTHLWRRGLGRGGSGFAESKCPCPYPPLRGARGRRPMLSKEHAKN
jgi:hypothetical protein